MDKIHEYINKYICLLLYHLFSQAGVWGTNVLDLIWPILHWVSWTPYAWPGVYCTPSKYLSDGCKRGVQRAAFVTAALRCRKGSRPHPRWFSWPQVLIYSSVGSFGVISCAVGAVKLWRHVLWNGKQTMIGSWTDLDSCPWPILYNLWDLELVGEASVFSSVPNNNHSNNNSMFAWKGFSGQIR